MELLQEDVTKVIVALVLGGLIGIEREYRDKAAGFRTIILICIGSALFTMLSTKIADNSDPARIAAQIVAGVGFLGAGAILRHEERVLGLTTAATIWLAAAVGMSVGSAHYELAGLFTGAILTVLWVFPFLERRLDSAFHNEMYTIVTMPDDEMYETLSALFAACGLRVWHSKREKVGATMVSTWEVRGSVSKHNEFTTRLFAHDDVIEFRT